MNRRDYLKNTVIGGGLLLPVGALSIINRTNAGGVSSLPSFSGKIMGTSYSVKLGENVSTENAQKTYANTNSTDKNDADAMHATRNNTKDGSLQNLANGAHCALRTVDRLMSTWDADSEISRFNDSNTSEWHALSSSTFHVVKTAMDISTQSGGAFDVTVGPLVDLWGFGAGAGKHGKANIQKPAEKAISHKLSAIGFQSIDIDVSSNSIVKQNRLSRLDLSGIAKGYAVDMLAEYLDKAQYTNYLVEVGGELRSRGSKPDGTPWRVAIENPNSISSDAFRVINLENSAVATSGDYRHYFNYGTKRYSHSIDPRTGYPTDHELASVSVIANSAVQADAMSTALMIMGPTDAMDMARNNQLAAHFIVRSNTGNLDHKFSPLFERYLT